MATINALTAWLQIPPAELPANFYRLLGVAPFTFDSAEIDAGFEQQRQRLKSHLAGPNAVLAARVLAKLETARACLLDAQRRAAYDVQLRALIGCSAEELAGMSSDEDVPSVDEVLPTLVLNSPAATPAKSPPANSNARREPIQPVAEISAPQRRASAWVWFAGMAACFVGGVAITIGGMMWLRPAVSLAPIDKSVDRKPAGAEVAADQIQPPAPPTVPTAETSLASDNPSVEVNPPPSSPPPLTLDPPVVGDAPPDGAQVAARAGDPPTQVEPGEAKVATGTTEQVEEEIGLDSLLTLLTKSAAPPPLPQCRSEQERGQYLAHVQAMLEAGLGKVRDRAKAKASYEQALALCDSDPRLYYGLALSLATTQASEASALLRLALERGAFAYPPAWRLLIDLEQKRSLDARLIGGLPNFATRLEAETGSWPDESAKVEFAAYLGRVVAFGQGPAGLSDKLAGSVAAVDQEILARLQGTRKQVYELAKADVLARYEELNLQLRPAAPTVSASPPSPPAMAPELAATKQGLADAEAKLIRTKEEHDRNWELTKIEFQKEWSKLEAEWKIAADTAQSVINQIARNEADIKSMNFEIFAIKAQLAAKDSTKSGAVAIPLTVVTLSNQVIQKTLEITAFKVQLDAYRRQGYAVQLRAQERLAAMAKAEAVYQRATRQTVTESSLIADKRRVLAAEIKVHAVRRPRSAAAVGDAAALKRLSTYAPLDVQAEAKRITQSYRTP